jgi:hypothetical protein
MPISRNKCFRKKTLRLRIIALIFAASLVGLWTLLNYQTAVSSTPRLALDVVNPVEAKQTQKTTMIIETLQKLCQVLSTAPLTAQETANSLGTIVEDMGKDLPLIFRPSDPSFREATIVRQVGTNEPAHVEMVLAKPGTLSVETLKAAFGNYSELPLQDLDDSDRIILYVDIPNLPRTCAVIADLTLGTQGVEDGSVIAVTVRRDIRLEN